MGKILREIAEQLKSCDKKVQLIYAFNGTGKTRLSREFKNLVVPKLDEDEEDDENLTRKKVLYYNAFTEDLFYWDNDLESDAEPKLKIQKNSFTDWILKEQGQDQNVISKFQHYTDNKLNPEFNSEYTTEDQKIIPAFSEVTFSFKRGNDELESNIKISKGEESNFIWSMFFVLLEQIIEVLKVAEPEERETREFDELKYIFIDDPVSSLDENHLIGLAVDLATLIKKSEGLKFVITTHNPLFYNVLYNELGNKAYYLLRKFEDGSFELNEDKARGDSNRSFSYHLYLKQLIQEAIEQDNIQKYHFTLLRNLYEKTAAFLGYRNWSDLLPDDKTTYYNRIIQFTSHSTLSSEAVAEPTPPEKQTVKLLLNYLIDNYGFYQEQNNQPENTKVEK